MKKLKWHWWALLLVAIGAINWGLNAFLEFNLVEQIFGKWEIATSILYALIGLAGIYFLWYIIKHKKKL